MTFLLLKQREGETHLLGQSITALRVVFNSHLLGPFRGKGTVCWVQTNKQGFGTTKERERECMHVGVCGFLLCVHASQSRLAGTWRQCAAWSVCLRVCHLARVSHSIIKPTFNTSVSLALSSCAPDLSRCAFFTCPPQVVLNYSSHKLSLVFALLSFVLFEFYWLGFK